MSEETKAVAAPMSDADYQQAALNALRSELGSDKTAKEPEVHAEEPPAPEDGPDDPFEAAALKEKKPEPKKEEAERAPDGVKKSFERLAQKSAELRKEREALETERNRYRALDDVEKARTARDPMKALKALGFTHAEIVNNFLDVADEFGKEPEKTEKKPEKDQTALEKRLERLEAREKELELKEARASFEVTAKKVLEGSKHRLVKKFNDLDKVMGILNDHYQHTGSYLGDTLEESIALAAEILEEKYSEEAKRWKEALTDDDLSVKNTDNPAESDQEAVMQPSSAERAVRSLSSAASGAAKAPARKPQTDEEYRQAAINELRRQKTRG
jgi:hypothetical protein